MPLDALLAQVLGPLGALVLAVVGIIGLIRVVQRLWAEHLNADADDRTQRDEAFTIARSQVQATNAVSEDIEIVAAALDDLRTAVAQVAKEVAGIRRDMAARRKNP